MPIKYFICPDNQRCEITGCLNKCRMGERCMSLPTLRQIGKQRPWTGKPSTTQLLKGTMEAYLEIIHDDLEVSPDDCMFMLLGTRVHLGLEELTGDMLAEEKIIGEEVTGIFDLYDHEERTLWDYKTSGSYKVAKALGLEQIEVDTGEVYKTGANKGKPKMKKEIKQGEPDCKDWELQLNRYRLMLEDAGFPVEHIKIEAIPRDGGTYIAKGRGIDKNSYIIPIRILPDDEVKQYFEVKSKRLLDALLENDIPQPCSMDETWNGKKCAEYCRAWKHCSEGIRLRLNKEVAINE